jgi:hypothetical protein
MQSPLAPRLPRSSGLAFFAILILMLSGCSIESTRAKQGSDISPVIRGFSFVSPNTTYRYSDILEVTGHKPGTGQTCDDVVKTTDNPSMQLIYDTEVLEHDNDTSWWAVRESPQKVHWRACANNCIFSCDTIRLALKWDVVPLVSGTSGAVTAATCNEFGPEQWYQLDYSPQKDQTVNIMLRLTGAVTQRLLIARETSPNSNQWETIRDFKISGKQEPLSWPGGALAYAFQTCVGGNWSNVPPGQMFDPKITGSKQIPGAASYHLGICVDGTPFIASGVLACVIPRNPSPQPTATTADISWGSGISAAGRIKEVDLARSLTFR